MIIRSSHKVPALFAVAFVLSHCGGSKREASAVVGAIDRYRDADNDHRPEKADLLDAIPCSDPEVCSVKTACTKAADPMAKGLRLKHDVESGLADVESGRLTPNDPLARGLALKIDDADRLIREGQRAMDQCAPLVSALRVKYGL